VHPERRFYLELSERLGCTAAEMLARMSSRELTERIALEKIRFQEQSKGK